MKKQIPLFMILILLLVGAGLYFYPDLSMLLHRMEEKQQIETYRRHSDKLSEEEAEGMLSAAEAYNETLSETLTTDPFQTGSEDPSASDEEYQKLLSVDGMMGYIDIPGIDVYLPVGHGTSGAVLKRGAGHLYGSALPVGGEGTHSVISAHRGLPSAKLFTDLDQIKEGDIFYYQILNRTLAYQVDKIQVIEPSELGALNPEPGKDYMTLLTCTPYGVNTHRLLVRGIRVPYREEGREK